MAIKYLTDEQLDAICERSYDFCGQDCLRCEAFQANMRYNDRYEEYEDEW